MRLAFARSDLFLKGLQGVAAPACAVIGIGASLAYSFALLFAAPLATELLKGGSQLALSCFTVHKYHIG